MKLREWMEETGFTIEDIAYKLRASRSTVFKWQQGLFKPSNIFMDALTKLTKGKVTKEDFRV